MSKQRSEATTRCVHLVGNWDLPEAVQQDHDKLGKVCWLVEHFSSVSKSRYNCEVNVTVDEIMVLYKGRCGNIGSYIKGKPVKFGIKVWHRPNRGISQAS